MDFENLEKLLGIEPGSVSKIPEDKLVPNLIKNVNDKTEELSAKFEITSDKLTKIEKTNENLISLEELDNDRKNIIEQAKLIYEISLRLLKKLEKDISDKITSDPKLWASAGPLINAVNSNLKTLSDINTRYRQEEELRQLTSTDEKGDDSLNLTWDKIGDWLEQKKKESGIKENDKVDVEGAILVDGEVVEESEESEESEEQSNEEEV